MGVLTCATVESISLDPDEGGSTRMRGGVPAVSGYELERLTGADVPYAVQLTLPAGYLGSSFIGAALIACVSPIPQGAPQLGLMFHCRGSTRWQAACRLRRRCSCESN